MPDTRYFYHPEYGQFSEGSVQYQNFVNEGFNLEQAYQAWTSWFSSLPPDTQRALQSAWAANKATPLNLSEAQYQPPPGSSILGSETSAQTPPQGAQAGEPYRQLTPQEAAGKTPQELYEWWKGAPGIENVIGGMYYGATGRPYRHVGPSYWQEAGGWQTGDPLTGQISPYGATPPWQAAAGQAAGADTGQAAGAPPAATPPVSLGDVFTELGIERKDTGYPPGALTLATLLNQPQARSWVQPGKPGYGDIGWGGELLTPGPWNAPTVPAPQNAFLAGVEQLKAAGGQTQRRDEEFENMARAYRDLADEYALIQLQSMFAEPGGQMPEWFTGLQPGTQESLRQKVGAGGFKASEFFQAMSPEEQAAIRNYFNMP